MTLRRKKSKKTQAVDALGTYLKFKAAGKAAKGAKNAASSTPIVKRVPLILAGAAAAVFVAFKVRGNREQQPPSA